MSGITRRNFVKLLGAGGAVSAFGLAGCESTPKTASRAAARVVVIGGGFGGASCAKYLRVYDPSLNVTMIEQNTSYMTCPGSNWVFGGLAKLDDIVHNYNALRGKHGVNVVHDKVTAVDPAKRVVTLASGKTVEYDRLVMSPGIDFRMKAIEGYDEAATQIMPHSWKAGPQTALLLKQLQAMPDGGTFIMCPACRSAARPDRPNAPAWSPTTSRRTSRVRRSSFSMPRKTFPRRACSWRRGRNSTRA